MAYVPNKLYVGFKTENDGDTLVAFMTPLAKDSAFAKRQKTIDDWRNKDLKATEIDNKPQTGFRLVDTSRRWNSNNVVFRVIHPDVGAEFEISAENLSNLMSTCDIIKGELQEPLLMIREGSKNILVQENSPEHLGSSAVDEKGKEIFVHKSLYKEGDRLHVKGRGEVIYLGKSSVHYSSITYKNSQSGYYDYFVQDASVDGEVLYDVKNDRISCQNKINVLKFVESTPMRINDAIGKAYSYNSTVFDVGVLKDDSAYEYKMIPYHSTSKHGYTYGYGFVPTQVKGEYEFGHVYSNNFDSYCDCTLKGFKIVSTQNNGSVGYYARRPRRNLTTTVYKYIKAIK